MSSATPYITLGLVHELCQPLAAALTYAKTVVRAVETSDTQGFGIVGSAAAGTVEQIERATAILRNFQDLMTGAGHYTRHGIRSAFEEAVACALIGVDSVGVTVCAEIDEARLVRANRIEIQQVIVNLIRNAVEAMRSSEQKHLEVSLVEVSGAAMIRVMDTGPGIDGLSPAQLFAPRRSKKPGGMGLGLCISRLIVEAHSGSIGAEPGPQGGAVFFFSLPLVDE
jgi:two-component system sensor kinase FixL